MNLGNNNAEYLGDGAYVHQNDVQDVVLTTGSHLVEDANDIVVLDPEGLTRLLVWLMRHKRPDLDEIKKLVGEG